MINSYDYKRFKVFVTGSFHNIKTNDANMNFFKILLLLRLNKDRY